MSSLEYVEVVRQFDLTEREFSALVEDTNSDMKNSLKASWMRNAMGWFAERMNPEKGMRQGMMSRYYKGMVDSLDTDHDHTLIATTPYYCQHYNQQHGLKLVTRPMPLDEAQRQKLAVPFTLMWHKRNGHNPKIIWMKSMLKQLYGEAFQSGVLSD